MKALEPELRIQFTKRMDGCVILRCTRNDNSVTWQRHDKHAMFFGHHDLSHFAVETVLGLSQGFYGLLADGWDIADTTGKGMRGKLSDASLLAEHIVGLLERERSGGAEPLPAAAFNAALERMMGSPLKRTFSDLQLNAVRKRIAALHRQWAATPPDWALDLTFDRSEPGFQWKD
jgi:hypothetical protein